ncbi:hypothetical protein [Maridesulfovibrio sp.]|uniref:hypothetical protein n=1 Tax=Maridesulfovibrio sp. TaxID=2795000 RepID=UPI003AFFE637
MGKVTHIDSAKNADPIIELYEAARSLDLLVELYRKKDREGDANILSLLSGQICDVAERLDSEDWEGRREVRNG